MKAIVYKFGQEQLQMDFSTEILGAENDEVKFLMGRSPQCHLVLDDQMISRELAEIIYSGNAWKIKKISDKGDVFVNGQNILEQNLNNGDVIKSGDFSINIELDQNEVSSNSDTNFPSYGTDCVQSTVSDSSYGTACRRRDEISSSVRLQCLLSDAGIPDDRTKRGPTSRDELDAA